MAVVPQAAGAIGLEFVSVGFTWFDFGLLVYAGNTIHVPAIDLVDAMPVDGMVKRRVVVHMNSYVVALFHVNQWTRNLSVESEHLVRKTRRHIDGHFIDRQVEFALLAPA